MQKVFTIFSYEDNEIKDVVPSRKEAEEWVLENREDRQEDCRIEEWAINRMEDK